MLVDVLVLSLRLPANLTLTPWNNLTVSAHRPVNIDIDVDNGPAAGVRMADVFRSKSGLTQIYGHN